MTEDWNTECPKTPTTTMVITLIRNKVFCQENKKTSLHKKNPPPPPILFIGLYKN